MKRKVLTFITMAFVLVALGLASGCGGSGSSSTTPSTDKGSVSGSAN